MEEAFKEKKDYIKKKLDESFKNSKTFLGEDVKDKEKGWKFSKEKEGCKLYYKNVDYSSYQMVRGIMTVKTKKKVSLMMKEVSDISIQKKYEKLFKKCDPFVYYKPVYRETEDRVAVHFRFTTGAAFVSDRDFLVMRDVRSDSDDLAYFGGTSFDEKELTKKFPKDDACVRGVCHLFCWKMERIDEENVRVEYLNHTNPHGWIPSAVFNLSCTTAVLALLRYMTEMKPYLDGKKELKDIEADM